MNSNRSTIWLSPEQTTSLAKLANEHRTVAIVNQTHGHRGINVEFHFPHRYQINLNGSVIKDKSY